MAVSSALVELELLRAWGNRVIVLCKRDKVSLVEDGRLSGDFEFGRLLVFPVDRALARMGTSLEQVLPLGSRQRGLKYRSIAEAVSLCGHDKWI